MEKQEELKDLDSFLESVPEDGSAPEKDGPLVGLSGLLDSQLNLEDDPNSTFHATPYTTEILENIQQLEPSLTKEQIAQLVDYARGKTGRPDFMDIMLTQTNDKLSEVIKLMVILQLLRIPSLVDYQAALRENLLSPSMIANMTPEDMSKVSANIQKEISDTLLFSLKTIQSVNKQNQMPTKVEKLANALMGVSEATRERIEEIIKSEM